VTDSVPGRNDWNIKLKVCKIIINRHYTSVSQAVPDFIVVEKNNAAPAVTVNVESRQKTPSGETAPRACQCASNSCFLSAHQTACHTLSIATNHCWLVTAVAASLRVSDCPASCSRPHSTSAGYSARELLPPHHWWTDTSQVTRCHICYTLCLIYASNYWNQIFIFISVITYSRVCTLCFQNRKLIGFWFKIYSLTTTLWYFVRTILSCGILFERQNVKISCFWLTSMGCYHWVLLGDREKKSPCGRIVVGRLVPRRSNGIDRLAAPLCRTVAGQAFQNDYFTTCFLVMESPCATISI